MKLFAVISILALSSVAFAANKDVDVVSGQKVTTLSIKSAYDVGQKARVSGRVYQTATLVVELSDSSKLNITAHNGVEAGWLVNYFNSGSADLKITDTVPSDEGKKKADPASIDNFKISVNGGETVTLDAFSDEFRNAAADSGFFTTKIQEDHSVTDLGEGVYDKMVHDYDEVKKDDQQRPFPAGSDISIVKAKPAIRLAD